MSPFETAADLYRRHPQALPLEGYLMWHLRHGFVYSTPDYFIMGRPVHLCAYPRSLITEHLHIFDQDICDAWYIHLMAGDMSKAWGILPYPLPWLCWERLVGGRREFRVYEFGRVRDLTDLARHVVTQDHELAHA